MSKILTLASSLNNVLLSTDEEEYDKIAYEVVAALSSRADLATLSLDNFDPSYQTIPFIYILNAQIDTLLNSGKAPLRQLPTALLPEGRFWPAISHFFLTFDPIQARYVGVVFTRLIDIVTRGAEQSGDAIPAIQLLQNAIIRLDSTSSTLTSIHYQYIRLCLLARAYAEAALILDRPIFTIPSAEASKQLGNRAYRYMCSVHDSNSTYLSTSTGLTQKITSRLYLEYFLMGATCYIALENYERALLFLEIVLVAPALQSSTSSVQLDAYKKWVLLSLIVNGHSTEIPRAITSNVARNLRALAKPYESIVDAFKSGNTERLTAEVDEGMDCWQPEGNYGLIHEVCLAFRKFNITRLEKTYEALSLEDVSRLVNKAATEEQETTYYVNHLVRAGQLHAQLVPSSNSSSSILRFSNEQSISEIEVEQQLIARSQTLQQLLGHISEIDHQMEISKDYIEWLQKLRASRDREKKGSATANRSLVTTEVQDEDMMDDM